MKSWIVLLLCIAGCRAQEGAPAAEPVTDPAAAPRTVLDSLVTRWPGLESCMASREAEMGPNAPEPTRIPSWGDLTFVEVPCGMPPGTGAYGYPFVLLVDWAAAPNSPEGDLPRQVLPTGFFERDAAGSYSDERLVTQAIPIYDDVSEGYVHLLYKYAGAGQCGLLQTYSTEFWRTRPILVSERERSCDAEPCEDDTCYDPMNWPLIDPSAE